MKAGKGTVRTLRQMMLPPWQNCRTEGLIRHGLIIKGHGNMVGSAKSKHHDSRRPAVRARTGQGFSVKGRENLQRSMKGAARLFQPR